MFMGAMAQQAHTLSTTTTMASSLLLRHLPATTALPPARHQQPRSFSTYLSPPVRARLPLCVQAQEHLSSAITMAISFPSEALSSPLRRFQGARETSRREIKCKALEPEGDAETSTYQFWDTVTEQLSASATFAFLLLQLPQIILNYENLAAGNIAALSAVPWTGLLTGLLGNLSLLSYFAGKKERGATVVQAVGVMSTFVVLIQLAIAGAMPGPVFVATSVAVVVGFIVNVLNYNNLLSAGIWRAWQEVISIGGVSVLPQVMWTTFEPYVPPSSLPGTIFLVVATLMVILGRLEKLPPQMSKFMGGVAAWSATLLFMWGPVAQMWTNYINPANIKGLSVLTILLAMAGNSLLLPRALLTRDLMWFTGSSWGALMQGWGILLSMYMNKCITGPIFIGISCVLALWLGNMCTMDAKANSLASPFTPLAQLATGKKAL